jgi:glycosyltransferase involved in cell wall biosynthesis
MVDISAVVCAYSGARQSLLEKAISSVLRQARAGDEIILVIDYNQALLSAIQPKFPTIRSIPNSRRKGLSGARNCGVEAARNDVVAFLDDDAEAEAGWIEGMRNCYRSADVLGAGGFIDPQWTAKRPGWMPAEFYWVVGCSYVGLPQEHAEVRNPIGCNMSLLRSVVLELGGFRENLGRTGDNAAGNEETELFIRAKALHPHLRIVYEPSCRAKHSISAEREDFSYFLRRCWAEGKSKAQLRYLVLKADWIGTERNYVMRTLPRGVWRGVSDCMVRLDPLGLARAATLVAGLSVVTLAFILALARHRVAR